MRYFNLGLLADPDGGCSTVIVPDSEMIPKGHRHLLSFLNADIDPLEQQVRNHIINTEKGRGDGALDAAYGELYALHPWFSKNPANASTFLNRIFAGCAKKKHASSKKQASFFSALFASRGLGACNAAYWINMDGGQPAGTEEAPLTASLSAAQRELKEMAVFLVDSSTTALSGLSPYKKIALYGLIPGRKMKEGTMDSFVKTAGMDYAFGHVQGVFERSASAKIDFSEDGSLSSPSSIMADAEAVLDNPAADAPSFMEVISGLDNKQRSATDEILKPASLPDLLSFEIWEMFKKGEHVERYPSGGFAVPENTGDAHDFNERVRDAYKKAYKAHHARIRYGMMNKEQLGEWTNAAKEMKEKVLGGEVPFDEFVSFLEK